MCLFFQGYSEKKDNTFITVLLGDIIAMLLSQEISAPPMPTVLFFWLLLPSPAPAVSSIGAEPCRPLFQPVPSKGLEGASGMRTNALKLGL